MSNIFRTELWPALLDILFPERCLACDNGLKGHRKISWCATCWQDVRLLGAPFCTICGKPFTEAAGENHLCGYCLKKAWHFKQARAAVCYQRPVAEAVKIFKYKGKMHGLATFATLSQLYFEQQPLEMPDIIIPVPLHVKRLRQRGFNQALLLCKKIFPSWRDKIAPHVLERYVWTPPQTGLRAVERRRNVRNVFRVREPEKIKNKKILLVDDVFTTGATADECAKTIAKSGAKEVNVFTFARTIE